MLLSEKYLNYSNAHYKIVLNNFCRFIFAFESGDIYLS